MGYKILNWYERFAWPPVLLAFVVALGVGGKHLYNAPASNPATVQQVLNFASVIAGFVITYSAMASDFTMYYEPTVSRCVSILGTVHVRLTLFPRHLVTGSSGTRIFRMLSLSCVHFPVHVVFKLILVS